MTTKDGGTGAGTARRGTPRARTRSGEAAAPGTAAPGTTEPGTAAPSTAVIDVRVLPWRPKRRVKDLGVDLTALAGGADLLGVVVSTIVAVLASLVLLVFLVSLVVVLLELWIVAAVALALVLARFFGLLPWVVDTGRGTFERYRWLPNATRP